MAKFIRHTDKEIVLALTRDECATLNTIFNRISGDPTHSARKHCTAISDELLTANLSDDQTWPWVKAGWQNAIGQIHFDNY